VLLHDGGVARIDASGLPVGMFCSADYTTTTITMVEGDALALYTDGLSETENGSGEEFGIDRLEQAYASRAGKPPAEVVTECLAEVDRFRLGPPADDITMMVITRH
jgi:sigma-B regulation protein RsbU (phosphoserine phosphatase)